MAVLLKYVAISFMVIICVCAFVVLVHLLGRQMPPCNGNAHLMRNGGISRTQKDILNNMDEKFDLILKEIQEWKEKESK